MSRAGAPACLRAGILSRSGFGWREVVTLKEIMLSEEYGRGHSKLTVALGKDIYGKPRIADLGRMPHVLIAGATGSGKSVMINTLISSILFSARPDEVQFIMIEQLHKPPSSPFLKGGKEGVCRDYLR